ncbi:MAG TPA: glycosyltransferase family 39 protein [Saprospiraceae bacterium]|nr:glycosyltransferase family 39 protein [Saprospiraceae bacterium]
MSSSSQDEASSSFLYKYRYQIFFTLILLLSVINLMIDIMEIDAAQYASISLEMSKTGNYLQVYQSGHDYLDKPPLLFWFSSLSISVFGNSNLAYKLPAIILLWFGLWATYKLADLWYDRKTGIIAALIFGTSQAFHLMTNDVRTDGLLTSFVILSVYFISVYLKKGSVFCLLIGGCCIGGAMLAKGPIGFIIPTAAIGGHLLISAQWKKIIDWKWLLLLPVIAVLLGPMLYGLYMQFDMHPEKEVYGLKGPSGIEFYFWTQSFGRITGGNAWQNDASYFFFTQSIWWDLSPWILMFVPALAWKIKNLFQKNSRREKAAEWVSLSGFVIPFIALSLSRYKLPHYIFPLFPFAAVMTSAFLIHNFRKFPRWFEIFYLVLIHFFVFISLMIVLWIFAPVNFFMMSLIVLFYLLFWWCQKKIMDRTEKFVLSIVTIALLFQFVLSLHFYPRLLNYQSTSQAGKFIEAEKPESVYWFKKFGFALDYYSGMNIPQLLEPAQAIPAGSWIYTNEEGLNELRGVKIIKEYNDYPVTLLTPSFLNPEKRNSKLKKAYLVQKE